MTASPERRYARVDVILFGLLAICIARLWLMVLPASLWVDELVTLFVIRNPGHPSFAIAPQVEDSVYFWLPKISKALLGTSEIALRIPSVLAMGLALYFVGRLAARLIQAEARWFAIFACLALDGLDFFAVDARPYALGMAIASMSVFYLVRWFDDARWSDELFFILAAALLWRVHLFYWPFYLVYAGYAAFRLALRDTRVGIGQLLFAIVAVSAVLMPVALMAIARQQGAHAHVFNAPPGISGLLSISQWKSVAICAGTALILRLAFRWKPAAWPVGVSSLALMLLWWLACPVCLFVYSRVSGNGVLILRYVSLMLPGLALAATAATGLFLPERYWKWAAVVMACVALAFAANWTAVWPLHEGEDWRAASKLENELASDATPVLCPSPFIEALPPAWTPDYRLPGFLYANLSYYPMRGRALVFPFAESPESDAYAAQVLHSQLIPSGRFILYGGRAPRAEYLYVPVQLGRQPELLTWHTQINAFGGVAVILYSQAPIPEYLEQRA